jgi:hypothetical protein
MKTQEDKIKERILKLLQPILKDLELKMNCEHIWKDKNGSANFRCKKCGYLVQDLKLDKLISIKKYTEKGLSKKKIKEFDDYI